MLYEYLEQNYEKNEPILLSELRETIDFMSYSSLRQALKRMADNQVLEKYINGVYFIPQVKYGIRSSSLDTYKVIEKKYLKKGNKIEGYITGLSMANKLQLTSQNPITVEVVTNEEKSAKRSVDFPKINLILRKPRIKVNNQNYKLLQVLDLLVSFESYSEEPLEKAVNRMADYARNDELGEEEVKEYVTHYPIKTQLAAYESGLIDAITGK